jgi:putative hydrolase of the HAD superfamily
MIRLDDYRAVFFDFGGTLAFDYPSIPEGLARMFQNLGLETTADEVERARGAVHQNGLHSRDYLTNEQIEDYLLRFFSGILKSLGFRGNVDEVAKTTRSKWRYYTGLYLFPEVQHVLGSLQNRGYILGVISNCSCRLPEFLEQLGVAPCIDFAIASDVFGVSKPDPRIFDEALTRANVRASQAIHVGDSYEADVVGAKTVGITPILIDRENQHPTADCYRINNLLLLLDNGAEE